jgi:hypothetical protein
MPRKIDVVNDAGAEVGNQYYWAAFGNAGGLVEWAYNGAPLGNVGTAANRAINCFDFILLLAARRGYVTPLQVQGVYGEVMNGNTEKGFASKTNWRGLGWLLSNWVWQDWPNPLWTGSNKWRPRPGDVVFLTEPGGGNHVVLAEGPNPAGQVHVISFGEGLLAPAQAPVRRLTIAQLRAAYPNVNRVSFVDPLWS